MRQLSIAAFILLPALLIACGTGGLQPAAGTIPKGEMLLKPFAIQRPVEGAVIRANVEIGNYWNYSYGQCAATHHSLTLSDESSTERAWVAKDSPEGKAIYAICKDGQRHTMTLKVRYVGPNGQAIPPGEQGIAVVKVLSEQ
jgi:hypothetical protein